MHTQKCFEWFIRQLISARCQYESNLAKKFLQELMMDHCCCIWHSGDYWILPQLLKFMWWIIQKQDRFNLASRVSNLRVWGVHTEAVVEVSTLSLACGLQQLSPSRATSARHKSSANFLNDVGSHQTLKYGWATAATTNAFILLLLCTSSTFKMSSNRFRKPVCNADTQLAVWMKLTSAVWHRVGRMEPKYDSTVFSPSILSAVCVIGFITSIQNPGCWTLATGDVSWQRRLTFLKHTRL